ncbi:hypothetical protein AG1IA_10287 [Rhizoctonia solani AG-1 IA]|uniref:DUF4246 domain-containing protein n=1 Tax=Thanatephorus cucumeris (strain AG1-IA) TaxID=983506 RepID=L8WFX4_THACA|nr:hypothetical protein AG1IA_10287 [Rhizoctonia solani AG-1 IA]
MSFKSLRATEDDDDRGCKLTWGMTRCVSPRAKAYGVPTKIYLPRSDPRVNKLGSVITCQDRCTAVPTTYQHRASPFELAVEDNCAVAAERIARIADCHESHSESSLWQVSPQDNQPYTYLCWWVYDPNRSRGVLTGTNGWTKSLYGGKR